MANKRIICKSYLRKRQCDKIWTYQAKQDMSVLFVISFELKRSLKSPCLQVELVSFSSSSPVGITFRLNSATFVSSSIAVLGLLCASNQRHDSGKNLMLKIVQEVEINIGLDKFSLKNPYSSRNNLECSARKLTLREGFKYFIIYFNGGINVQKKTSFNAIDISNDVERLCSKMKLNHGHMDNIQKPKPITHCSPPEENLQEAWGSSSDGQCAPVPYKISEQW